MGRILVGVQRTGIAVGVPLRLGTMRGRRVAGGAASTIARSES